MFIYEKLTDYERILFLEDYILVLKKSLREKEKNQKSYKRNIHLITEEFKQANPRFKKLSSYKREMKTLRIKSSTAIKKADKLESKNFILRAKVRELTAMLNPEENG